MRQEKKQGHPVVNTSRGCKRLQILRGKSRELKRSPCRRDAGGCGWAVWTLVGVLRGFVYASCFISHATMRTDGNAGRPQGSPPHILTSRVPTAWARAALC